MTRDGARKILSIDELGEAADVLHQQGKKIVLCHGVFDLLHVGHLRHLKSAAEHGDVLVVSITGDKYVNKGPDRPAFPSELRAELLAGLELVDYVTVVEEPSAAPSICAAKPDCFVKGGEYFDPKLDITGKIVAEKELVESFGGQLVFTRDITFSSSNLLNKFFASHDEAARDYLTKLRRTDFEAEFTRLLERIEGMRFVVIGETIIDRYVYVDAMGKAAKENIIATLHRNEEVFAGGVIAVANNLAALSPNVELITVVGDPELGENYEKLVREHLDPSIKATFISLPGAPTVQKTRFVEPTYVRKLFEVYNMDDRPMSAEIENKFHEMLSQKLDSADVAIVCDFGHGMISNRTVELLEREARFLAVNTQSNAGNIGYNLVDKYHRADLVCLDATEARLAVRDKHASVPEIVSERLPELVQCPNIIVTHGRAGCYTRTNGTSTHIPSVGGSVIDTVGAGDAFFALAAPCVAAGASCEIGGFVGNVAGAIKIGIVGHRRYLTRFEIQRYISTLLK
jgi:rfaE bifunctional protein kinase chain/domain/rfaE bifunctional protein nucleotidyltransferase chain/domain